MIVQQLLLVPVLYVVQEMIVRPGVLTGQGHGSLIRSAFGRWWALLSASTLFLSSVGALITEFAAVAGVGEMFGISRWVTIPVATAFLIALSMTGSRRAGRGAFTRRTRSRTWPGPCWCCSAWTLSAWLSTPRS